MRFKTGDWVEIVSHHSSNLDEYEWPVGKVFKIHHTAPSGIYFGNFWIYTSDRCNGILDSCVRPAKNKIIIDILKDL